MINRYFTIMYLFIASFGLTILLTPSVHIADDKEPMVLEDIIPKYFGDWEVAKDQVFVTAPTPEIQELQSDIYQQVLMRTYKNSRGERIMLAIAYGNDQSDSLQAHKPEVCYSFQGFQILSNKNDKLFISERHIPVKRLVAQKGNRIEPITYWITVGNTVPSTSLQRKIEKLKYGLNRKIPDGMLVRVSSISANKNKEFMIQEQFLSSWIESVAPEYKNKFIGRGEKG